MKNYFEAYDERYRRIHQRGTSWSSDIPTPIVAEIIERYSISPDSSILEAGCGEGRDSFILLEKGYDVLATDISTEAISYCCRRHPEFSGHFQVLDCLNDSREDRYDFIFAVAVIHMLVEDRDRDSFYRFFHEHLKDGGLGLVCSMGDGTMEAASDISQAFSIVERDHESGSIEVPATSMRMVSLAVFEEEIRRNGLDIVEKGITHSLPDFNNLMYAVIRKHGDEHES